MSKNILIISEDTVIDRSVPLSKFRAFFKKAISDEFASSKEFPNWLNSQTGKTCRKAAETHHKPESKNMTELLSEERFNIISDHDKSFVMAFDNEIQKLGYDFGGSIGSGYCWGRYMIIYSKTGVKSKKVIARIYVRDDSIILRLFFDNIDKHASYIQSTPEYIRNVFVGSHGDCSCNPQKENCRMRKTYTIDGKQIEKCSGVVFEFWNPDVKMLSDYMGLLSEFYPIKAERRV